jgi:hypothetical protein
MYSNYILSFLLLLSVTFAELQQTPFSASFSVNTYTRYTQFINTLTKTQSDGCRTVHSSGGAAGGIVSEGQGYGLFFASATAVALGTSHVDFTKVRDTAYAIFKGWKRMCKSSTGGGNCQSSYFCSESGTFYPCLPHWKFSDNLDSPQTGSAPDGDIDAILGMIILTGITESAKPTWWTEVATWCYDSIIQFYTSEVLEDSGNAILKLGACWGGLDCNNPSYHAPGAFRAARNFLSKYGSTLGKSATQVTDFVAKYNKLIDSSYKIIISDQNQAGLTTNWYVPVKSNLASTGTTGCSGSGTPAAEYGAEAARGVWRVAIDYLWFASEAPQATTYLDKVVKQLSAKFTGSTFNNLDTGGLVSNIFNDWLNNAFIYGPTFCALLKPVSTITNQQAAVNVARDKINGDSLSDYYKGSWLAIATITLSGDLAKCGSIVGGKPASPTTPPTTPPTTAPVAPVKPPTAPVKPPTSPTAPTAPTGGPKCTIPGCTVSDKKVQYAVSGVTVTTAEVQCSGSSTRYPCTLASGIYTCTMPASVTACASPVPYVNGAACAITFPSASQSCKPVSTTNVWWHEYTPPGTGWSEKLASIKCADGRYFSCPNNYGTKVACPISDRECSSPTALYNGSPCAWSSALVEDGLSSNERTSLPTGAIIGIVVGLVALLIVVIALILLKKKMMSEKEEIV